MATNCTEAEILEYLADLEKDANKQLIYKQDAIRNWDYYNTLNEPDLDNDDREGEIKGELCMHLPCCSWSEMEPGSHYLTDDNLAWTKLGNKLLPEESADDLVFEFEFKTHEYEILFSLSDIDRLVIDAAMIAVCRRLSLPEICLILCADLLDDGFVELSYHEFPKSNFSWLIHPKDLLDIPAVYLVCRI